ncbi:MAG: phosphoribosylanthranilate isomerase [Alphaproteobacteria bacterium]|nr:phosphoribosylanthranilate isomerase [Alphaproteobacteria bacterium]
MALVKICGLRTAETVDAALRGEARYLGFNFFPKSPRFVTPDAAAALAAPARGRADTVAVVVDADDALLAQIAARLAPDWIQLHGKERPDRAAEVRRFARKGVIKALAIARPEDFEAVAPAAAAADMLLFDAKAPAGAVLPGGNGAAFDWTLLTGRTFPKPWLLSGGLTPENVGEAVRASGASQVDVASGVERAPGVKDPDRIMAFLAAAAA